MLWFILYLLFMFGLSLGHARLAPDKNDYFICGRKAGAGLVAFSLLASCIGGTATIGMVGLAWQCGWPAVWWLGSGAFGLAMLGLFLARRVRATRCSTLPEVASHLFGNRCRLLAAIIILVSSIAILAAQFEALGSLLGALCGLSRLPAVILGAASLLAYTWLGGQLAVMKSDVWQFFILAAALCLLLLLLLGKEECRAALSLAPPKLFNTAMPPERAVYFLLVFGSSFLVGPMLFGRLLSARSSKAAKRASLWAAFGLAVMAGLIAATGIALSGLSLPGANAGDVIFAGMRAALPPWGAVAILLGLISAVISSADSCLLTAATIWANDIRSGGVRETRQAMLALALLGSALVFGGKGILGLLLAASDIYVCGIVCPVAVGLLGKLKSNSGFFPAAMLAGGGCGLLAALTGKPAWSFVGLALSLFLSCIGLAWARSLRHRWRND